MNLILIILKYFSENEGNWEYALIVNPLKNELRQRVVLGLTLKIAAEAGCACRLNNCLPIM